MGDPANPLQGVQLLLDRIDVLHLKVSTSLSIELLSYHLIFVAYYSASAAPLSHVLMSSGQSIKLRYSTG